MFSGTLNAKELSKSDYSEYLNNKIQDGCQNTFFLGILAIHTCKFISECHSTSPTDLFRRICYCSTPGVSVVCYVTVCQPAASYSQIAQAVRLIVIGQL